MIENIVFFNESHGVRLDAVLLDKFPTSSRAFIREALDAGKIAVQRGDASPTRPQKGMKLRGGEKITVRELAEVADNVVLPHGNCPEPCYADEALLGFNKPTGMPVQPLSRTETGTLMNAVVTRYPECIPLGDRPLLAGAIHRIDADTSGLVLVARNAAAFDAVRAQFAAHTVKKTYLALVEGEVTAGATLEHDLIHDPTLPFCRMIDARHDRHSPIAGKLAARAQNSRIVPLHAVTAYTPLQSVRVENEIRTLLEVVIYTGVTHQIRAQLALAGHHIINDRLYGAFAVENMSGHCLHSLSAEFLHPVSGERIVVRAPEPEWVI